MTMTRSLRQKRIVSTLLAASLLGSSLSVHADEREDLEKLRATVLGLVETLVKNGVIPRNKADAMMREAEARATTRLAQSPPSEVNADGKKIVRVAYVPEAVKVQMREQIKAEVLAETRADRMGGAGGGGADSGSRLQFEGDVRLRAEVTRLKGANTPISAFAGQGAMTRAADAWGNISNGVHTFNTQENTSRERVRVRAGVTAVVSDTVTAGLSISTGNATGSPTSTNQTMGQGFNKYSLVVDRAYIKYAPESWLSMSGGRIRNPYFSTDLVWADDLNFEGFALTLAPKLSPTSSVFLTAGWFPMTASAPNQSHGRSLFGIQSGLDWQIGQKDNRVKVAAAYYNYHGIEGAHETMATFASSPDYGTRSEYGAGYRQRGNTLFMLNAPNDAGTRYWGLASEFRELDLTASVDIAQFDPMHVVLTGDVVKNLGFKRSQILARTGVNVGDGRSYGYMGRIQVGAPQMTKRGDWNVAVGYRYLGSDAVLDAYTNSDFGLGGTNTKGFILGLNYGIAKNTWLSARWMSSDLIDSMAPLTNTTAIKTKFGADLFQIDLNAKY